MHTVWGALHVADAHVHFFSHRFFSLLASQAGLTLPEAQAKLGWLMPPEDPAAFAALWKDELDQYTVARASLIASLPGDEDSVAAAVRAFPDRFTGYFLANPLAPDALDRTRRAFDKCGLRGLCLFPAMHRYSLHDGRVRALISLAAERPGTLVFVHCGVLSVGVRNRLGLPSSFDLRYSNPIDLHGIALDHPRLPFVIPHFGAGFFREALMVADLCPNVHLDTSSSNSWRRYLETPLDLDTVFRRALAVCGPSRLLFGTDSSYFPRGWHAAVFTEQAQALEQAGVGAEAARAIFGGNLERLLGLEAKNASA